MASWGKKKLIRKEMKWKRRMQAKESVCEEVTRWEKGELREGDLTKVEDEGRE